MKFYTDIFKQVISLENLFKAFDEFKKDKLKKKDVLAFEWNLESNILELHRDLKYHKYKHDVYTAFTITDPKQRKIHKACVRDRVLHHALFRILYPLFEPTFISNSFSCRIGKGSHKGIDALAKMLNSVSKNNRKPCFALKCDVKKFFDSIDHQILLGIIQDRIKDENLIWLIEEIVGSFGAEKENIQLDLFGGANREREREREREIAAFSRSWKRHSDWQPDKPTFCQCLYERVRPVR
jgi:retron-type reverse transcriptase